MSKGVTAAFCAALIAIGPAWAAAQDLGPETNLPLPRFVSLKAEKANIRRGPGLTHRIDWVFLRRGMPLEVLAEHGHWRKVRDVDDATGWVHHAMLRGSRTAVVTAATAFRALPEIAADRIAIAEPGVIVDVEACGRDWCEVEAEGHRGWAPKSDLWGARPEEVFE